MKYWEIIADNLSKAGWSWGCVSVVDSVADAQRGLRPSHTLRRNLHHTAFWIWRSIGLWGNTFARVA